MLLKNNSISRRRGAGTIPQNDSEKLFEVENPISRESGKSSGKKLSPKRL